MQSYRSVYRATAPLRGGFGVSGVPLFWQHLQKKSRDTVPQKLPANKTYGYLTGGKAPFSDLEKCTAVLTPVKGIFHPNFSGKKGPENSGSL